jgi:Zn-dependent protease
VFGERSVQVVRLFGTTVHTNLEAVLIMLATALAGTSWLHGALIVASFALGTGLHLASHWAVAVAFGKGIDRMVLTRAGRIDYSGAEPGLVEYVVRTAAGPTMNGLCALAGYATRSLVDVAQWHPTAQLALGTFTTCSLILLAINFLPAIPLDGGLILQRILAHRYGDVRAAHLAALVSIALMGALVVGGALWPQPVPIYLGVVIGYDTWRKHLRVARGAQRVSSAV